MIILAHRGLRSHGPENTLAGFQGVADAAARGIPLGIEFDARRSADDVLVTLHDDGIRFGTHESHLVIADTWYESAQHHLGEQCPPRLEDALDIVAGVPLIDIDIKERGYTKAVIDAASHIAPEQLSISSHIPEVISEARDLVAPGTRVGMSVSEHFHFGIPALFELLESTKADFLFLEHNHITPEVVERLHAAGKEIGAYTVNDQQRLHELIKMGVDFPCTDKPEMAVKELATAS